MNTRIMAVALVVVVLLGAKAAQAQEVDIARVIALNSPLARTWASTDKTVVILGQPNDGIATFPSGCGLLGRFNWGNIEVVVIEQAHVGVKMTMHPRSDFDLAPGARLGNVTSDSRECCLDEGGSIIACSSQDARSEARQATFQVIQPASAGLALFWSPVELSADSMGVVTGQPNDDGTYTVIFKKQGSPAQKVDIESYVDLLPADVLRNAILLGEDTTTGHFLYVADIEW